MADSKSHLLGLNIDGLFIHYLFEVFIIMKRVELFFTIYATKHNFFSSQRALHEALMASRP